MAEASTLWKRLEGSTGRLCAAGAIGSVVAASPPYNYSITLRVLIGWSVAASVYLLLAGRMIWRSDAEATQRRSTRDDPNRGVIDLLLLLASLASLGGVMYALAEANRGKHASTYITTAIAIIAALLSWLLMHTIYAMHYARLYYHDDQGEPRGGLDFHSDEDPDYRDFTYLAFSIACTFGVTDVDLTGKHMRRTVMKHSLLAFGLATINFALVVNVLTNLLSGS